MNLDRFIAERRPRWEQLEALVTTARRGRLRSVSTEEMERFGILYRHAASDLAVARRDWPEDAITDYLNSLCARAHPLLYRGPPARVADLRRYFLVEIPRTFRAAWPYMALSLGLLLAGVIGGWLAVDLRPDLRDSLVPSSGFDELARGQVQRLPNPFFLGGFIITNNIRVAVICFCGGVFLGLLPAFEMVANGWMLGTLGAAVHQGGYDWQFWQLIVPHGVLELSVIVIAGGTGLMLGDSILRPGLLRRGDALGEAAKRAMGLALGTASLLIIAGTVEAFVSPSGLPGALKIAIGCSIGIVFYSWLLLGGRERRRRQGMSLDVAGLSGAGLD